MPHINIKNRKVGPDQPVYFIADIASNHCGSLTKAKELVHACAESGVDAVKMQNFSAETIVSDFGFKNLKGTKTHQSSWKSSVFDSYKAASIPLGWTEELRDLAQRLGLHYFTSPYSIELVRAVAPHVCAFKLGSGDLTWHDEIKAMAETGKPLLIATGASTMDEVEGAMSVALANSTEVLLMQCNTEYTARVDETREQRLERFSHVNLRVLETYARRWPRVPVGLSDHTHGDMTVLASVGLFGCCAVEKHFTFDNTVEGQDHAFSMTPASWSAMARRTAELRNILSNQHDLSFARRLEIVAGLVDDPEALRAAIGDGIKRLESNESGTVVVQRRAIRTARDLPAGHEVTKDDLVFLRPCPTDAMPPYRCDELLGRKLTRPIQAGDCLRRTDCE